MRVLVDSSVWIDFLNGHPSAQADRLEAILEGDDDVCTCGVVVAEVLQGIRSDASRRAIRDRFRDLRFLEPAGFETYERAAALHRALRARGRTVRSMVDCLIVTIAEEHRCRVLARDRDIATILASGLTSAAADPAGR